ncbi:MAG: rhodanese-like domain-containing protein [Deltaproteobacteria bacterium]|nr:rhodanese-like domain-containing protein [Deltaproteobacteria bacterium]
MFSTSRFKEEVAERLSHLEIQVAEIKKTESELKLQNAKLSLIVRNLARKLVTRLPISLESLEKGLHYDLIFSEEVETWKRATRDGIILDLRPQPEYVKNGISGAMNIPLDQLALRSESLLKDQAILLVCENGIKSVSASEILASKGFMFIYVLKGGMSMHSPKPTFEAPSSARDIIV